MHLVLAVGIINERTVLPKTFAPDLRKLGLHTQVEVEVADEPVDLVPDATIVAVGIVVITNNVTDLGHMVRIVDVRLTHLRFKVFSILINIVVIVATKKIVDTFVIMRP